MSNVILIAAAAENNALGKDNDLLWHLPDDFKRFKSLTTGFPIIMGRKTFESFPKPLPNRTHIIITRDKNYKVLHDDCFVVHSLEDALELAENYSDTQFIIGGGEIYNQSLKVAHKIELTRVHHTFEADTFFPKIDNSIWKETSNVYYKRDDKNEFDYSFISYTRQ